MSVSRVSAGLVGVAAVLVLVGCQGAPASTSTPGEAVATQTAAPEATSTLEESPSAAPGDCLDPAIVAALDELDSGNLDTDPSIDEVADALEALPLEGAGADARDSFVEALREDPPNETRVVSAALALRSQVALPEC